jgi:hypothetical protein
MLVTLKVNKHFISLYYKISVVIAVSCWSQSGCFALMLWTYFFKYFSMSYVYLLVLYMNSSILNIANTIPSSEWRFCSELRVNGLVYTNIGRLCICTWFFYLVIHDLHTKMLNTIVHDTLVLHNRVSIISFATCFMSMHQKGFLFEEDVIFLENISGHCSVHTLGL